MTWIEQKEYNRFLEIMPIVCVDVAILHDDLVLLVKRDREPAKGQWWLPGGRLYKNEMPEACALRKAQEETGLSCAGGSMIHYQSTVFGTIHSVNFCFVLYPISTLEIKLDDTSSDYRWLYIDHYRTLTNDYILNCLRALHEFWKIPYFH